VLGALFLQCGGAVAEDVEVGGACGEWRGGEVFRCEFGDLGGGPGVGGDLFLRGVEGFGGSRFGGCFFPLRVEGLGDAERAEAES
jgi:hypothetical protein